MASPGDEAAAGPSTCPACGAIGSLRPIVYGLPSLELRAQADRDEVVLGGCLVDPEDPTHFCRSCERSLKLEAGPDTALPNGGHLEPNPERGADS